MSIISNHNCLYLLTGHSDLHLPSALMQVMQAGDALVLLQEAVWLALAEIRGHVTKQRFPDGVAKYVLQFDLDLRGLADCQLRPGIIAINDDEWAQISEQHPRAMTWTAC